MRNSSESLLQLEISDGIWERTTVSKLLKTEMLAMVLELQKLEFGAFENIFGVDVTVKLTLQNGETVEFDDIYSEYLLGAIENS